MKDSAVGTEEDEDEFNDREEEKEEENPFDLVDEESPDSTDCDFYSNNYWKVETSYDINEMMKDFI